MRAILAPKSRHAMLRFRFNAIKTSIVLDTFPKVMDLKYPGIDYKLDKSNWYVTLPNESEIWFGGLDDKERTEKILGQEYATIFLNECSQIPFASRNIAVTRLAQSVMQTNGEPLKLRLYYDYNPPSKGHWTYKLFEESRNPDDGKPVDPSDYAVIKINPKDNEENLPPEYIKMLEGLPPRQRKRFLEGEYAETGDNALWSVESIDRARETEPAQLTRVVIAVDPSGADDDPEKNNDAIGIVVAGMTDDGYAIVLADYTIKASPAKWGKVVADQFDNYSANLVIGEVNYGGAMVEHVIQTARAGTPYKGITASRGKHIRAEPIAALFDTGKIRLAGSFPELEEEMCSMTTAGYGGDKSPNRLDAMVFALTELFPALTKNEAKNTLKHRPKLHMHHSRQGWMGS